MGYVPKSATGVHSERVARLEQIRGVLEPCGSNRVTHHTTGGRLACDVEGCFFGTAAGGVCKRGELFGRSRIGSILRLTGTIHMEA